ncbi:UNVERIFIED_CONTAM: hypothetical protein PYX00_006975 [Menopon gallinae]|uniref:Ubiquinone biosynthesis monooxygenase COQ6, mitochondrial n=1 Tax=Menopon gallinae TaxID=328185 RepID=A0AAW2HH19_9NEOP
MLVKVITASGLLSRHGCRKNIWTNLCFRSKHYDIAITGGGLVGTAMACAIAKNNVLSDKKVILFDAFPKKNLPKKSVNEEYNNRVFSLNPGTRQYFEMLGVWKHISDVRYKAVKKMQVWDACSEAVIIFNEDFINDVSYIVENDVILYALAKALEEENASNITIEYESKIKNFSVTNADKLIKIETEAGNVYSCNLLIGADGANSQTRKALGKPYLNWDYDQLGIVATLKLSEPTENNVAWQRFLPSGPIALLPLTDDLSSLVWSVTTKEGKELMQLSDECFVDAINDALWKVYPKDIFVQRASEVTTKTLEFFMLNSGAVRQLPPSVAGIIPKSRVAFPLGFGHATEYIAPGVALIGDAAHRVHPLAGQGVNLGFGDVRCLSQALADGVYIGKPIGSLSLLKKYQSERQRYNFPTMLAIDCLQKLYGTTFTPVVALRTVGLQVTNALHPVKEAIIRFASM